MNRPYYTVVVRYRHDFHLGPWEIHNGFYEPEEADDERKEIQRNPDVGMVRILRTFNDKQETIECALANANERIGYKTYQTGPETWDHKWHE